MSHQANFFLTNLTPKELASCKISHICHCTFKEHLDQLKTDFNAAKIITVQDYNDYKQIMWMEVFIYSVKAKNQAGNKWVKHIMTI